LIRSQARGKGYVLIQVEKKEHTAERELRVRSSISRTEEMKSKMTEERDSWNRGTEIKILLYEKRNVRGHGAFRIEVRKIRVKSSFGVFFGGELCTISFIYQIVHPFNSHPDPPIRKT